MGHLTYPALCSHFLLLTRSVRFFKIVIMLADARIYLFQRFDNVSTYTKCF